MALLSCSNYAEMSLNSQHRYLELSSFGILTCSLVLDFSSLQTNIIDKGWPAKQLQLYQVCPSSYNMGKVRCLQIIRCQAWRSLRKDITLCIEFTIFHPVWVHPFNLELCASLPASQDYMSSSGLLVSLQMHRAFWQPYNLELGALLFLLIYHLQRLAELQFLVFHSASFIYYSQFKQLQNRPTEQLAWNTLKANVLANQCHCPKLLIAVKTL